MGHIDSTSRRARSRSRSREHRPDHRRHSSKERHRDHSWERQQRNGAQHTHGSRNRSGERDRERNSERERDRDRDRERDRKRDRDWGRHDRHDASHHHDREGHGRGSRHRGDEPGRATDRGRTRDDRKSPKVQETQPPRQQQQEQPHRDHHEQRNATSQQEQRQLSSAHGSHAAGKIRGKSAREEAEAGDDKMQRWGKPEEWAADEAAAAPPTAPKEGPNMGLSGKLAAETNKAADGKTEMKYQPPPEARVCRKPPWKLFVFKGDQEAAPAISLTQHPFYLFGKDRKVVDIPTDHPTCSRQHAVLVFREVEVDAPDGIAILRVVKPYLIDLESVNGSFINGERVEAARYYELLQADVIKFGHSTREYVIMNEAVV